MTRDRWLMVAAILAGLVAFGFIVGAGVFLLDAFPNRMSP